MMKKNSLAKRYQKSFESKDSGGVRKGVMNYDGVDFYKPEAGRNRINIVPYTIKTKNHPLVKAGDLEIGDKDYLMDVWVHRNVGASEASVLCLKKTFGKPCPICEQAELFKKQGKEKESKDLRPGRRVFYNVQDLKDGKLKVFETSHYLFEKELIEEARDDEEGYVNFADEEEGKEISFKAVETKKGTMKFFEFKSFRFEDRDSPLDEDVIEGAVSFDEIMNVPTYDEAQKVLFGSDEDEENDDLDTEDEDDEPPKPKSKAKAEKKPKPEPEDDDESEDEPEEKPSKPKGKPADCPHGHKFGADCDTYDECDDCTCWDKCCKANSGK